MAVSFRECNLSTDSTFNIYALEIIPINLIKIPKIVSFEMKLPFAKRQFVVSNVKFPEGSWKKMLKIIQAYSGLPTF